MKRKKVYKTPAMLVLRQIIKAEAKMKSYVDDLRKKGYVVVGDEVTEKTDG